MFFFIWFDNPKLMHKLFKHFSWEFPMMSLDIIILLILSLIHTIVCSLFTWVVLIWVAISVATISINYPPYFWHLKIQVYAKLWWYKRPCLNNQLSLWYIRVWVCVAHFTHIFLLYLYFYSRYSFSNTFQKWVIHFNTRNINFCCCWTICIIKFIFP